MPDAWQIYPLLTEFVFTQARSFSKNVPDAAMPAFLQTVSDFCLLSSALYYSSLDDGVIPRNLTCLALHLITCLGYGMTQSYSFIILLSSQASSRKTPGSGTKVEEMTKAERHRDHFLSPRQQA